MKIPSRTTMLLSAVLAGILLAGAILWRAESRHQQYSEKDGRFEQKYRLTVNALRLAQDSVKDRFRNNCSSLKEVKNPVPVPVAVKETGVQQQVAPASAPIILQGISWAEERPVAMINGKVYLAGDQIDNFTVNEIRSHSILLSAPDGTKTEIKLIEDIP
jgi:hypothetical protein